MKRPELLDFQQERIRVLHWTWIAFFVTFYVWFNMAPLATTMLKSMDWMTKEHIKILAICNVALTIPARIIIGAAIDKWGPRIVFSVLMITMSVPAFVFAFGNSFAQLAISRLILGSIGAGFVIGIRMVAQWFPKNMVGRAEGFYAGWGNFGSAWAAITLPWIALTFCGEWLGLGNEGWRYALAFNGLVSLVYGIAYPFLVKDLPGGKKFEGNKKVEPMKVSSYGDLIQYLLWSFPLVGAIGVLVWRISGIQIDGAPILDGWAVGSIHFTLLAIYIGHVVMTLRVNLPHLKEGVPDSEKYHFGSVAALNSTYFANFGAELAVVSMLPMFFQSVFETLRSPEGAAIMTATLAGAVASSFAVVNLVARPLGGLLSDTMKNRKRTMLIYMVGITLGFLGMANIGQYGMVDGQEVIVPTFNAIWWIVVSVLITVACSMFVQGAEGATFALIPMIKKDMTGQIAGMAGAYGNVGAVIYLVVFSLPGMDSKMFFYILAAGAAVSFIVCWWLLEEPKDAFAEEI
jgi:MFS transporter, NNP family, nitrate/nitrite transporter